MILKKTAHYKFKVGAKRVFDAPTGVTSNKQFFAEELQYLVRLLSDMVKIGCIPNETDLESVTPCPHAEFVVHAIHEELFVVPPYPLKQREVEKASTAYSQAHFLNGIVGGWVTTEDQRNVLLLSGYRQRLGKEMDEFECLSANAGVLIEKKEACVAVCVRGCTEGGQRIPDADVLTGSQIKDVQLGLHYAAELGSIWRVVEDIHPVAEVDHLKHSFEQAFFWMVKNQTNGVNCAGGEA